MLKVKHVEGRANRVRLLFYKLKDLFMLIEFDRQAILDAGYDLATPIIISNSDDYREIDTVASSTVEAGQPLLSVSH